MKRNTLKTAVLVTAAILSAAVFTACGKSEEAKGFAHRLDTEAATNIDIAGFFGNYEALDAVTNSFNEIYPNVTLSYEQVGADRLNEYMKASGYVDIFMTADDNIRSSVQTDVYVNEYCTDLLSEDIDLSAVTEDMLRGCTVDGKILKIPSGQKLYGMVVNKTLLENEGLSVPQTYSEFIDTLKALKDKGYTPIQGSSKLIYSYLITNMTADLVGNDADFLTQLTNSDDAAVQKMTGVYSRLKELIDNGYTDPELNASYPDDNYDQAILNFFEGDVPFWVCNSENASGMKKRESKSEKFSAEPFDYGFCFIPMGDNGVYDYKEAWYGFSLNKNSDNYDYALEFLRFLATEEQLDTLASVKRVPTVTKNAPIELYADTVAPQKVESTYVNDGSFNRYMIDLLESAGEKLADGTYQTAEEAAADFVSAYN